jgi:uncharacterized membrane protein HdeD (DUF308 family)
MTDPRIDPPEMPGQEGGMNPPGSSGQQVPGQGAPHQGTPGQNMPGQGPDSEGAMDSGGTSGTTSTGQSNTGASSVGTATRTTTSTTTSVPQQGGRVPSADTQMSRDYETGTVTREPGMNMLSTAANKSWPALLLGALGMIAVGVILLVWPHASLIVVSILIGAALIASGLVRLWEGFTAHDRSGGMRAAYVVIGLLAVLVGLYFVRHHAVSLFFLAFLTGVYFVALGVAEIGVAATAPGSARLLRGVLGLFSIAAGILMVVWPAITLVLLLTLVAAWLLFYGCMLAAIAFGVRRAGKSATRAEELTTQAMPARAA